MVDLGEDGLLPGDKVCELLRRGGFTVEGLAAQIPGKALVEAKLVVKLVAVGGIIHQVDDLLIAHAGEIGIPLFSVHIIKAEHKIIVIPRAVFGGAHQNVKEGVDLALSALFFDFFQHIVQLIKAHTADDTGDVTQICHK